MNMGAQIGAALTASLTPWIAGRFGWTMSFLVAAALCLLGAASWLVVDPSQQLKVLQPDATALQIQNLKGVSDQPASR
jgi:ACS family glucarate transporter-like MFS transporter